MFTLIIIVFLLLLLFTILFPRDTEASKKDNRNSQYPNGATIFGIVLVGLSFASGDILNMFYTFGSIFQQTALTNALGFLGLGSIIVGSVRPILWRLDEIIKKSE